jgi:hypothetical protein
LRKSGEFFCGGAIFFADTVYGRVGRFVIFFLQILKKIPRICFEYLEKVKKNVIESIVLYRKGHAFPGHACNIRVKKVSQNMGFLAIKKTEFYIDVKNINFPCDKMNLKKVIAQ